MKANGIKNLTTVAKTWGRYWSEYMELNGPREFRIHQGRKAKGAFGSRVKGPCNVFLMLCSACLEGVVIGRESFEGLSDSTSFRAIKEGGDPMLTSFSCVFIPNLRSWDMGQEAFNL
jgi:hypothetical protein